MPLLLLAGFAWFDYDQVRSRARDHVETTADALAEHAQKVIETVDLVLARVLDRVEDRDWGSIAESRDVHDFLYTLDVELPQIESVFLVAPDGLNAASSRAFPLPTIYVSDREYFHAAVAGDRGLFVSAPFKGRLAGTYAFTITRPRTLSGRFDGLAGVTISPTYFTEFYQAVLEHPDMSYAALLRDDGALLVRVPEPAQRPTILPFGTLLAAARRGAAAGIVDGVSQVDGHRRMQAFRRLQGVPLIVGFGIDHVLYLRDWYTHVAFFAVPALLLSATILLAGRAILRESAREQEAMRRLVEETARRREAEAALQQTQKMEALGRIAGGVAHDFNNLLTAILGCLELLQRQVAAPRALRLVDTARQAAERGAELTAQMLAFSRRREIAIQSVDVNATILGIEALLRRAAGSAVRIRYDLTDSLCPALADSVQVEMALINLAVNARDAMPDGGTMTISTSTLLVEAGTDPRLAPGSYLRVSVADSGHGMSEEVRARALEPFFTTKEPGRGTGLGLSMIFGFATAVGGTVTIDSVMGQGTTVHLLLPCATGSEPQPQPALQLGGVLAAALRGGGRILLVDDDEAVRTTVRIMLEEEGYIVVEAEQASSALELLETDRAFDLLMVDFAMPAMNGAEFAHEVVGLWPEARFLFITGFADSAQFRPWLERGAEKLDKPFSRDTLAGALRRVLAAGAVRAER